MRLTGSSEPGAVARDRAMWLLQERVVLATAVCRELVSATRDDLLDSRPRAALDLLLRWVGEHYEARVETHPQDGLASMVVPPGEGDLRDELWAATRVCEALAMLHTADTPRELREDAVAVRSALREWESTVRGLRGEPEPDDDGWPPYAVHLPYRSVVVRPGGELRHRDRFPIPAARVHVLSSSTPTSALLGSGPAGHGRLVETLQTRGLELWSAVDPDTPDRESVVVRGLSDDEACELGRAWGRPTVVRWTEAAWTEVPCDGSAPTDFGWRLEQFDRNDVAGDGVTLRRRRPDRTTEQWTVSGVPGGWTVHHRGSGTGLRTTRHAADDLLEVVGDHPEIGILVRGAISEYTTYGAVQTSELARVLRVDPTEGLEDPTVWPADLAAEWYDADEPWDGTPWIDRWAAVDGHRLSAVWAGGRTVVVPRDAPVDVLATLVADLRAGRDVDLPWPFP